MFARAATVCAALLMLGGAAWGNGRNAATISVVSSGADIFVGATYGGVLSRDGGRSFGWICEDALGYGGPYDPELTIGPGGVLMATTFTGLARSEDHGCSWGNAQGDLAGHAVSGIALAGGSAVVAVTASGGRTNGIFRSTDGGRTFTAVAGTARAADLWTSVRASAGGQRVYASSYTTAPPSTTLWVSTDAGQSFNPIAFAPGGASDYRLLGVDRSDPMVLWARTTDDFTSNDRILRSGNGGTSFTSVFTTTEVVTQLAQSGTTTLLSTRPSGIARAPDGIAFTTVPGPHVIGIAPEGATGLLGCTSDPLDGHSLARSTDQATSWTPIYRQRNLAGVIDCPAGAVASWLAGAPAGSRETRALCTPQWSIVALQLGVVPPDDAGLPDAAPPDAPSPDAAQIDDGGDGCGCRTGAGGGKSIAPLLALLALLLCRGTSGRRRRAGSSGR